MPDSPTSEPESDFVCDCEEWMRTACTGEPFYKEHEGKRYCVLHFPGKEKSSIFRTILQKKRDKPDFNFRGVWFPDDVTSSEFDLSAGVDFRCAIFSADASFNSATFGAYADFRSAIFSADVSFRSATFSADVSFRSATFRAHASFRSATFCANVCLSLATFNHAASFSSATFNADADFLSATFSAHAAFRSAVFRADASFSSATFRADASFSSATFAGHVTFAGDKERLVFADTSSLDLQFARIEKPDHVSFQTLRLRPHWFVRVDPRKFQLTNVDWDRRSINEEIRSLDSRGVSSPHRLLAIACGHLAVNAEDDNRYEEASRFRYMAMDARRREKWRGFAFWSLSWWYWLASGYGERVFKAFLVLLSIWLLAGLLYTQVGFARLEPKMASETDVAVARRDDVGAPLKFSRALTYSAGVITLQKPEPRPATTAAQTIVLFETILGPVQAALLALAIRRKFMR
jgi:hypothetical protein